MRLKLAIVLAAVALLALLLAPFQLLGLAFDWKIRRWLPRYWHKAACWLLGIQIHSHGALTARRPLMIAANHASWTDILVLGALADVAFIAKTEVKDWPFFGLLAKLQKSVFIVREEKRRAGDQASEIGRRMADGEIVVLFPEGTTSDGNRLLEVKSSLFGAAAAALPGAPDGVVYVQPVAIAYTRVRGLPMGHYWRPIAAWPGDVELLPHLSAIVEAGAIDVDVSFGEPIAFREGDRRKHLSMAVEKSIRRMLLGHLRGRNVD